MTMLSNNGKVLKVSGGSDFSLVFSTDFKNLNNGVDTPIVGTNYSTILTKATGSTPTNATTAGAVSSSPSGDKMIIPLTDYFTGKEKARLHFLVRNASSASYATRVFYLNGSVGVYLAGEYNEILLLTSNTSIIKVPHGSPSNNRTVLSRFVKNYTNDGWCSVDYDIDLKNKIIKMYLYGILVYETTYNSSNKDLHVSLWDGVTLHFTDVRLYVA